jgi:hypothetical protein
MIPLVQDAKIFMLVKRLVMKQYILIAVILFLVLTSTTFAFQQKPGKPLEPESTIQLNEDIGKWEIVGSKTAGQADEPPSYITRPNCAAPPVKDLLLAPHLVDAWIDNECINPAELEKVIAPIVEAIPANKVKDNMNGYDLLSRLAPSNKLYRAKKKYYDKIALKDQPKIALNDQPKEAPKDQPKEEQGSILRKKAICSKYVDDNGLIEETLDIYFPVDRFGPKPHSLNDWCYDQDNKELSIIINHKNESEATAKDLANRILQDMILASKTMKRGDQRISPFQKDILSKGITVIITWPGRKSPAAWAWAKSQ